MTLGEERLAKLSAMGFKLSQHEKEQISAPHAYKFIVEHFAEDTYYELRKLVDGLIDGVFYSTNYFMHRDDFTPPFVKPGLMERFTTRVCQKLQDAIYKALTTGKRAEAYELYGILGKYAHRLYHFRINHL